MQTGERELEEGCGQQGAGILSVGGEAHNGWDRGEGGTQGREWVGRAAVS